MEFKTTTTNSQTENKTNHTSISTSTPLKSSNYNRTSPKTPLKTHPKNISPRTSSHSPPPSASRTAGCTSAHQQQQSTNHHQGGNLSFRPTTVNSTSNNSTKSTTPSTSPRQNQNLVGKKLVLRKRSNNNEDDISEPPSPIERSYPTLKPLPGPTQVEGVEAKIPTTNPKAFQGCPVLDIPALPIQLPALSPSPCCSPPPVVTPQRSPRSPVALSSMRPPSTEEQLAKGPPPCGVRQDTESPTPEPSHKFRKIRIPVAQHTPKPSPCGATNDELAKLNLLDNTLPTFPSHTPEAFVDMMDQQGTPAALIGSTPSIGLHECLVFSLSEKDGKIHYRWESTTDAKPQPPAKDKSVVVGSVGKTRAFSSLKHDQAESRNNNPATSRPVCGESPVSSNSPVAFPNTMEHNPINIVNRPTTSPPTCKPPKFPAVYITPSKASCAHTNSASRPPSEVYSMSTEPLSTPVQSVSSVGSVWDEICHASNDSALSVSETTDESNDGLRYFGSEALAGTIDTQPPMPGSPGYYVPSPERKIIDMNMTWNPKQCLKEEEEPIHTDDDKEQKIPEPVNVSILPQSQPKKVKALPFAATRPADACFPKSEGKLDYAPAAGAVVPDKQYGQKGIVANFVDIASSNKGNIEASTGRSDKRPPVVQQKCGTNNTEKRTPRRCLLVMSSTRKERAPASDAPPVGVTTPAKCNDVVSVAPPPPLAAAQEEVNIQQPLIDIEPLSSDRPQQSSDSWERERVRHPYHCFTPQYYTPTPHAEVRVPGLAPTHSYPPTRDRNSYKNFHHPLHPPPQSIHGAVPVPNCGYPHISPYHPAYKQRQLQQQQQVQWARSGGDVACWPFRLPMEGDNNNDQPYLVHQQHQQQQQGLHPVAFVHRPFIQPQQQQQPQYDRHRNLSPLAQQQQYINQDSVCPLKEMYQKQQYKYCQPEQQQPPQQHHYQYHHQQQARPQVGADYRTGAAQQPKRVPQPQQPQYNAYVPPFGRFHHEFQQYAYQHQPQQPLQQDYIPRDQMHHRNYNNDQRQDVYSGFNNYNPQQNQHYAAGNQQQQWRGFGGNVGENYQQQQQPSSSPLHQFQHFFQQHFSNKFFKVGNGQYRQTSNNPQQGNGNNHQYYNSPMYPQQQQQQQYYYQQPNMNYAAQGGQQHFYNNNYDYFNSSQNDIFVERRKFVYEPVVMPAVNVTVQRHFITNLFGGTGCPLLLTAPKKRRSTEEKVGNNNDILEINGGYSTVNTTSDNGTDQWATVQSHSSTASRARRFAIVASVYRRASLCSDASSMDPAAWMEGDVWRQLLEGGCFNKDITTFSVPSNVDLPDWNSSDINNFTPQWNGTGNRQDEMCMLKARQPDFSVARVDIFDVENPEFNVTACALIPTKLVKDRNLPRLSNSKDKFLWTYDPNTASRCLFDDDESDGSISESEEEEEEDNLLPFLPLERTFSISDVKSLMDENYECDDSPKS